MRGQPDVFNLHLRLTAAWSTSSSSRFTAPPPPPPPPADRSLTDSPKVPGAVILGWRGESAASGPTVGAGTAGAAEEASLACTRQNRTCQRVPAVSCDVKTLRKTNRFSGRRPCGSEGTENADSLCAAPRGPSTAFVLNEKCGESLGLLRPSARQRSCAENRSAA